MLQLKVTADSRIGCVRPNNEDMLLIDDSFLRDDQLSTTITLGPNDRCLLALADGMGGHNSGDVASSDTLHNLHFFFNDMPSGLSMGDFNELIYEWLESINHIIDSKGHSSKDMREMGTTLVAMAYYEGQFCWMNCGDSRLYRFQDGQLTQLTTDHSLNTLLGSSKHSNMITNCIGGGCKTSFIDLMHFTSSVRPGDRFLLCSDGLNDMIPDAQIKQMLADGCSASALCLAAEAAGGYDNVSAIVITVNSL